MLSGTNQTFLSTIQHSFKNIFYQQTNMTFNLIKSKLVPLEQRKKTLVLSRESAAQQYILHRLLGWIRRPTAFLAQEQEREFMLSSSPVLESRDQSLLLLFGSGLYLWLWFGVGLVLWLGLGLRRW